MCLIILVGWYIQLIEASLEVRLYYTVATTSLSYRAKSAFALKTNAQEQLTVCNHCLRADIDNQKQSIQLVDHEDRPATIIVPIQL